MIIIHNILRSVVIIEVDLNLEEYVKTTIVVSFS